MYVYLFIESYAHFCNHFRERPGTKCTECTKCDLYKTDPENELIEKAATKAKQQYIHAHPELKQSSQTNIIIGPKSTFIKLGKKNPCWKSRNNNANYIFQVNGNKNP